MFKGNLSELSNYQHLPAKLLNVIEHVKQRTYDSVKNGHYPIEGDKVFFFVVDDNTQLLSDRRSECHRKYVDVQILLAGEERYGYSLQPFQSIAEDLLDAKDIAFSEDIIEEQFTDLNEQEFIIFNVAQPHRPLVAINEPMPVRKAIIKVANDWLEA
ncbi:YhcH/YjgK/YiaL family protein [Thalassotalea sp. G20_0]|uniref:YhcH/YjgK/YiaL family protein n=1 Tax=Thalassotalea sp. G20_0 TaxID=2821093 RepID=UPI001ADA4746|nr:YhcH/YjgK/YiaL family protein [Thalassotalea sp. G20_0]